MNAFSRNPARVPAQEGITVNKIQFCNTMKTRPAVGEYRRTVGPEFGQVALENAFTESLRSMNAQNYWEYGCTTGVGKTELRFRDYNDLNKFFEIAMDAFFSMDIKKIKDRTSFTLELKRRAKSGSLYMELLGKTEAEKNYYIKNDPYLPQKNAPIIPPKPKDLVNQSKAISWATAGLVGDKTAFTQKIIRHTKFDGSFPLGANMMLLDQTFSYLVFPAPLYRGWNNTASQQKYPSNIGGKKILSDIIAELGREAMPHRGENQWYDLALYILGSIIAVQAITDGNKRMSRFAYALITLSGGVDFIAPTDKYGSELGNML